DRLDGDRGETDHRRRGEEVLSGDHGLPGAIPVETAEGSAAPDQDSDKETNDDRRETHAGIDDREKELPPSEAAEAEPGPGRISGRDRERRGDPADRQRRRGCLADVRVERYQARRGLAKALKDEVHLAHIGVALPRVGK